MKESAGQGGIEERLDPLRDVGGEGRGRGLIGDGFEVFTLDRAVDDHVDEARLVRAEDPGNAKDQMLRRGLEGKIFALELGEAVVAQRICRIAFGICGTLHTIKNVIGADVNEARAFTGGILSHELRREGIDGPRLLAVEFAPVDVGQRCAIQENVVGRGLQQRLQRGQIRDIDLGPRERTDFVARGPLTGQHRAETAFSTEQENAAHRREACGGRGGLRKSIARI